MPRYGLVEDDGKLAARHCASSPRRKRWAHETLKRKVTNRWLVCWSKEGWHHQDIAPTMNCVSHIEGSSPALATAICYRVGIRRDLRGSGFELGGPRRSSRLEPLGILAAGHLQTRMAGPGTGVDFWLGGAEAVDAPGSSRLDRLGERRLMRCPGPLAVRVKANQSVILFLDGPVRRRPGCPKAASASGSERYAEARAAIRSQGQPRPGIRKLHVRLLDPDTALERGAGLSAGIVRPWSRTCVVHCHRVSAVSLQQHMRRRLRSSPAPRPDSGTRIRDPSGAAGSRPACIARKQVGGTPRYMRRTAPRGWRQSWWQRCAT